LVAGCSRRRRADEISAPRQQLGLEAHVLFPGPKGYAELPYYYGLAEAFIHASTTEQWGLVVNEAMAAGLPVLVSERCGCAPDLVVPGFNGLLFSPEDVKGAAKVMVKSLTALMTLGPWATTTGSHGSVVAAFREGFMGLSKRRCGRRLPRPGDRSPGALGAAAP
jgi:glycosyltransferase involved in cell wall biosynthesis